MELTESALTKEMRVVGIEFDLESELDPESVNEQLQLALLSSVDKVLAEKCLTFRKL